MPLLQAVLLLAAGDQDGAAAAAQTAAEAATEAQRSAHTTRLAGLAKHAVLVEGGVARHDSCKTKAVQLDR